MEVSVREKKQRLSNKDVYWNICHHADPGDTAMQQNFGQLYKVIKKKKALFGEVYQGHMRSFYHRLFLIYPKHLGSQNCIA